MEAATASATPQSEALGVRGLPLRTSTMRSEEVYPKADIVLDLNKGGCVNIDKGGGGFKIPFNLQTHSMKVLYLIVWGLHFLAHHNDFRNSSPL